MNTLPLEICYKIWSYVTMDQFQNFSIVFSQCIPLIQQTPKYQAYNLWTLSGEMNNIKSRQFVQEYMCILTRFILDHYDDYNVYMTDDKKLGLLMSSEAWDRSAANNYIECYICHVAMYDTWPNSCILLNDDMICCECFREKYPDHSIAFCEVCRNNFMYSGYSENPQCDICAIKK